MFQCTYRNNGVLVDCPAHAEYYAWYKDCGGLCDYLCKTHAGLGLIGVGGNVVTHLKIINQADGAWEHAYADILKNVPGTTIQQKIKLLLTCYELNCGGQMTYGDA